MKMKKYLLCCGAMAAFVVAVCVLCVVIFSKVESDAAGAGSGVGVEVAEKDEDMGEAFGAEGGTAGTAFEVGGSAENSGSASAEAGAGSSAAGTNDGTGAGNGADGSEAGTENETPESEAGAGNEADGSGAETRNELPGSGTPESGAETSDGIEAGDLTVTAKQESSWGSGSSTFFLYNLTLSNETDTQQNGWTIRLTFSSDITLQGGWDGEYEVNGNVLTISAMDYNAGIEKGGSLSGVGFIIQTDADCKLGN